MPLRIITYFNIMRKTFKQLLPLPIFCLVLFSCNQNQENIEVNPLYFAKERPMVKRGDQLIMVDDERYPLLDGEKPEMVKVRFRTLGCYPLTAAVESSATSITEIVEEVFSVKLRERATRLIDGASEDSMEKKKTEGYF